MLGDGRVSLRGVIALYEPWSVNAAKAQLSEVLRRAGEGTPQRIGLRHPCIVISEAQWREMRAHLGAWLVDSAPRGAEMELPSRECDRPIPFSDLPDET